ncbi:MAG: sigma 54-interacting transcriptional regulator, partial [bacterium]
SAAAGGSLFLDEIATASPGIQVKLLRALEQKEITPVGSTKPFHVDVRLLAATNANLAQMASNKEFREDLFYRLNVFHIHIPPLRERQDDIVLIAESILDRLAARTGERKKKFTAKAEEILKNWVWKGNVRELENVLERALLMAEGDIIGAKALPEEFSEESPSQKKAPTLESAGDLPSMEIIEKAYIYWVLESTGWKKNQAAEILGIDTSTLYRKIEKYGLKEKTSK